LGVQPATQVPPTQVWPVPQVPQLTTLPQPSLTVPQVLPEQLAVGVQQALGEVALHTLPEVQQTPLQTVPELQGVPARQVAGALRQVVPQMLAAAQQPWVPPVMHWVPALQAALQQIKVVGSQVPVEQLSPPLFLMVQVLPSGTLPASAGVERATSSTRGASSFVVVMRRARMCNRRATTRANSRAHFRERRYATAA
jgi:hypothetical protein